eukprot:m.76901 g.76901  ORF g.76901 m.76901 type:complete len:1720 (+) comp16190_c0_seq4:940-6099(+)
MNTFSVSVTQCMFFHRFWMPCTSSSEIRVSMTVLALLLGIDVLQEQYDTRAEQGLYKEVLWRLNRRGQQWLLCIDGLDDEKCIHSFVTTCINRATRVRGHVIVTSKLPHLRHWVPMGIANPIDVYPLLPSEASVLMFTASQVGHTQCNSASTLQHIHDQLCGLTRMERQALEDMSDTSDSSDTCGLEGMPLAIELVAHYVRREFSTSTNKYQRCWHLIRARYEAIKDDSMAPDTARSDLKTETHSSSASPLADSSPDIHEDEPTHVEDVRRRRYLLAVWVALVHDKLPTQVHRDVLDVLACMQPGHRVPHALVAGICTAAGADDASAVLDDLVEGFGVLQRPKHAAGTTSDGQHGECTLHPMVYRLVRRCMGKQRFHVAVRRAVAAVHAVTMEWSAASMARLVHALGRRVDDHAALQTTVAVLAHARAALRLATNGVLGAHGAPADAREAHQGSHPTAAIGGDARSDDSAAQQPRWFVAVLQAVAAAEEVLGRVRHARSLHVRAIDCLSRVAALHSDDGRGVARSRVASLLRLAALDNALGHHDRSCTHARTALVLLDTACTPPTAPSPTPGGYITATARHTALRLSALLAYGRGLRALGNAEAAWEQLCDAVDLGRAYGVWALAASAGEAAAMGLVGTPAWVRWDTEVADMMALLVDVYHEAALVAPAVALGQQNPPNSAPAATELLQEATAQCAKVLSALQRAGENTYVWERKWTRAMLALARAYSHEGRVGRAVQVCNDVLAACAPSCAARDIACRTERATAWLVQSRALRMCGVDLAGAGAAARRACDECHVLAGDVERDGGAALPARHLAVECALDEAVCLHEQGHGQRALDAYRTALRTARHAHEAATSGAQGHGDETAVAAWGLTVVRALAWSGRLLAQHGDADGAEESIRRAISMADRIAVGGVQGGARYGLAAGTAARAVRWRAWLRMCLGDALLAAGDAVRALESFHGVLRPGIAVDPENVIEAHIGAAQASIALARYDTAAAALAAAADASARLRETAGGVAGMSMHDLRQLLTTAAWHTAQDQAVPAATALRRALEVAATVSGLHTSVTDKITAELQRISTPRRERPTARGLPRAWARMQSYGASWRHARGGVVVPFGSRDTALDALAAACEAPRSGAQARVVVVCPTHGHRRVGVTQLVRKYADRSRHDYPGGTFWLDASSAATLRLSVLDAVHAAWMAHGGTAPRGVGPIGTEAAACHVAHALSEAMRAVPLRWLLCIEHVAAERSSEVANVLRAVCGCAGMGGDICIAMPRSSAPAASVVMHAAGVLQWRATIETPPLSLVQLQQLLFRYGRGHVTTHAGEVQRLLEGLVPGEMRAVEQLCVLTMDSSARYGFSATATIPLLGAYIYDMGMRCGSFAEHLVEIRQREVASESNVYDTKGERRAASLLAIPNVLGTAVQMAWQDLSPEARLVLQITALLEMALLPQTLLDRIVSEVMQVRHTPLATPAQGTPSPAPDPPLDAHASVPPLDATSTTVPAGTADGVAECMSEWVCEELVARYALLRVHTDFRIRMHSAAETVFHLDGDVGAVVRRRMRVRDPFAEEVESPVVDMCLAVVVRFVADIIGTTEPTCQLHPHLGVVLDAVQRTQNLVQRWSTACSPTRCRQVTRIVIAGAKGARELGHDVSRSMIRRCCAHLLWLAHHARRCARTATSDDRRDLHVAVRWCAMQTCVSLAHTAGFLDDTLDGVNLLYVLQPSAKVDTGPV